MKHIASYVALAVSLTTIASRAPAVNLPSEIPVFIPVEQGVDGFPLAPQPIVPAIIKLLAAESGLNLVPRPLPWRRAQVMSRTGKGLLYGAAVTPERSRVFKFTEPLDYVSQWLVSTTEAPLVFHQWEDVRGKVLSIISGARYGTAFEARREKLFMVEQNSPVIETRLKMLRAKRVDAVLVASYLGAAQLEAKFNCMFPGQPAFVVAGRPVDMEPLMIAVPRLAPLESSYPILNATIKRLAGSGRLQRVRSLKAETSNCE